MTEDTGSVTVETPVQRDILDRWEPPLSSTGDTPQNVTPKKSGPALSVGTEGENGQHDTPPVEAKPVLAQTDPAEAAAEAADAAESKPDPAAKKPFSERLADIARSRDEAIERATKAEERAAKASEAAEKRLTALTEQVEKLAKLNERTDPADIRPERAKFDDPNAYDDALIAWAARQGEKTAATQSAEQAKVKAAEDVRTAEKVAAEATAAKVVETFNASVTTAKAKYADFDAKVTSNPALVINTPTAMALMQADDSAEIAYYLANNPEEAARIASVVNGEPKTPYEAQMAMNRASVEIGKIAGKLAAQAAAPAEVAKPKVQASKAPAPIVPVGAGSGGSKKPIAEMSMDEYARTVPEYVQREEAAKRMGIQIH